MCSCICVRCMRERCIVEGSVYYIHFPSYLHLYIIAKPENCCIQPLRSMFINFESCVCYKSTSILVFIYLSCIHSIRSIYSRFASDLNRTRIDIIMSNKEHWSIREGTISSKSQSSDT